MNAEKPVDGRTKEARAEHDADYAASSFKICRDFIILYIQNTPKKIYEISLKAKNARKIRPEKVILGNTEKQKNLLYYYQTVWQIFILHFQFCAYNGVGYV